MPLGDLTNLIRKKPRVSDALQLSSWSPFHGWHALQGLLLPFSSCVPNLFWDKMSIELMEYIHEWCMHICSFLDHVLGTWDPEISLLYLSLVCFWVCEDFFPELICCGHTAPSLSRTASPRGAWENLGVQRGAPAHVSQAWWLEG